MDADHSGQRTVSYKVGVAGLRDLRRELKRAGDEFPKELRDTNFRVANEVVVPTAQRKARSTRRPHADRPRPDRGHWEDYPKTIRALASQTRATVALGSARVPWALGANFGSLKYTQFPGLGNPDHALYAAIEEKQQDVIKTYGDMLDTLTKKAFPE